MIKAACRLTIILGVVGLSGCLVPVAAGVLIGTAVVAAPPAPTQETKALPPIAPMAGSPVAMQSYSTLDDGN
jgi:hypothetical protein